jgi:hypothetical protein
VKQARVFLKGRRRWPFPELQCAIGNRHARDFFRLRFGFFDWRPGLRVALGAGHRKCENEKDEQQSSEDVNRFHVNGCFIRKMLLSRPPHREPNMCIKNGVTIKNIRFQLSFVKEEEMLKQLVERIGKKFEELRKKMGYKSYESFAFDHELPRMQYWRIEKGKTNITLKTLVKLLVIHGMTVEEFFNSLARETKPKKMQKKPD